MEQHIRMYCNISLFLFLIKFNLLQVFLWIQKSLTHHEERTSRETYTWWSLHFMNCENHPQQKQRILQDTGRVFECTQSGALLSLRHQLTYLKQQLPYTCQRWLTTIAIGSSIDPLHHSNWLAASTWNVQPANVKVERPKLETNAMSSRLCVLLLVDASLRSAGIREDETILNVRKQTPNWRPWWRNASGHCMIGQTPSGGAGHWNVTLSGKGSLYSVYVLYCITIFNSMMVRFIILMKWISWWVGAPIGSWIWLLQKHDLFYERVWELSVLPMLSCRWRTICDAHAGISIKDCHTWPVQ